MSTPDINLVGLCLRNRTSPAYSSKWKNGNRYGDIPAIVSKSITPQGTRRVALQGTWNEDSVMTIKTNGAVLFGDVGPNVILYLDAAKLPIGPIDSFASITHGTGVTFDYPGNDGLKFQVVSVPGMPNNRGIVNGTTDATVNGTNTPRVWVHHSASPRFFESRCSHFPQANQDNVAPYMLQQTGVHVGTARTWQEKGIWNMANSNFGSSDTNLFMNFWTSWSGAKFEKPNIVNSNSLTRVDGAVYSIANSTSQLNMPYPEPITYEYIVDQGSANDRTNGSIITRMWASTAGIISPTSLSNNLTLTIATGSARVIDTFTYPGFTRGYNVPLNMNKYDAFIYKSNGPGAACRVLISNNANYKLSTKSTIQLIKSWDRNEIQFYARSGWFDLTNLKGYYLNIIGADNEQITSIRL